jgi:hypothetical protein
MQHTFQNVIMQQDTKREFLRPGAKCKGKTLTKKGTGLMIQLEQEF